MASPEHVPGIATEKIRLQDYLQRACGQYPIYQTIFEGPPHARQFKSQVFVDGIWYASPNAFSIRKVAENDAAKHAFIGFREKLKAEGRSLILEDIHFCKAIINEYAVKMNMMAPTYVTNESKEHARIFVSSLQLNGVTFTGDAATTKKAAEQFAARSAILINLVSEAGTTMSEILKSKVKYFKALTLAKDSSSIQASTIMGSSSIQASPVMGSSSIQASPVMDSSSIQASTVLSSSSIQAAPVMESPNVLMCIVNKDSSSVPACMVKGSSIMPACIAKDSSSIQASTVMDSSSIQAAPVMESPCVPVCIVNKNSSNIPQCMVKGSSIMPACIVKDSSSIQASTVMNSSSIQAAPVMESPNVPVCIVNKDSSNIPAFMVEGSSTTPACIAEDSSTTPACIAKASSSIPACIDKNPVSVQACIVKDSPNIHLGPVASEVAPLDSSLVSFTSTKEVDVGVRAIKDTLATIRQPSFAPFPSIQLAHSESASGQPSHSETRHQSLHVFKKPKLISSVEAVTPPIVFVPPTIEQASESPPVCSTSGKKRRKNKKARKNLLHQSPSTMIMVPQNQVSAFPVTTQQSSRSVSLQGFVA
ncbi:uncharacterized protein [Henckelia pumila]|uniref:uncharacterized protein n=1 Tax=Henckelia pumila TaxID=405737 RepID=UPI003C6E40B1